MKFSINTNRLKDHYSPAQIVQECLKAGVQGIEFSSCPPSQLHDLVHPKCNY